MKRGIRRPALLLAALLVAGLASACPRSTATPAGDTSASTDAQAAASGSANADSGEASATVEGAGAAAGARVGAGATAGGAEVGERVDSSVRLGSDLYRRSYDEAQKEITADNAHERLTELERQIDLERQRLK